MRGTAPADDALRSRVAALAGAAPGGPVPAALAPLPGSAGTRAGPPTSALLAGGGGAAVLLAVAAARWTRRHRSSAGG